MKTFPFIALAAILLAGCDKSKPAPAENAPPAKVEVGGEKGGVRVSDPADGVEVEVGGGKGVEVKTPNSKVDVKKK